MRDYHAIAETVRTAPTLQAAADALGMTRAALAQLCYRLRKRYPASFPVRAAGRPPAAAPI